MVGTRNDVLECAQHKINFKYLLRDDLETTVNLKNGNKIEKITGGKRVTVIKIQYCH